MRVVICTLVAGCLLAVALTGFLAAPMTAEAQDGKEQGKAIAEERSHAGKAIASERSDGKSESGGDSNLDEDGCPAELKNREPWEVYMDHMDALAAADWDAVACNYHPDAFVIDDQGVNVGREEIVAALMSLHQYFDFGEQLTITDVLGFEGVIRDLWTLDGGWIVIPDGTSTYHIANGQIVSQTWHGTIEFTGPPPDQQ